MKNYIRETKGVTLVALVVTIIILLILAGIAINLAVQNNGILTKTKNIRETQDGATILEAIKLDLSEFTLDNWENMTEDKVIEFLKNYKDAQGNNKPIIDNNKKVNVQNLVGSKLTSGNGTGTTDIYKIEDNNLVYYYKDGTRKVIGELWKL